MRCGRSLWRDLTTTLRVWLTVDESLPFLETVWRHVLAPKAPMAGHSSWLGTHRPRKLSRVTGDQSAHLFNRADGHLRSEFVERTPIKREQHRLSFRPSCARLRYFQAVARDHFCQLFPTQLGIDHVHRDWAACSTQLPQGFSLACFSSRHLRTCSALSTLPGHIHLSSFLSPFLFSSTRPRLFLPCLGFLTSACACYSCCKCASTLPLSPLAVSWASLGLY